MSKLTALALSIAVLGGIWAYLALGPLSGMVLVWAGFIAWGCFFHSGADAAALQKTIVGMSYGAIIAGIALFLVGLNPLGWTGGVYRSHGLFTRDRRGLQFVIDRPCECLRLCCDSGLCSTNAGCGWCHGARSFKPGSDHRVVYGYWCGIWFIVREVI